MRAAWRYALRRSDRCPFAMSTPVPPAETTPDAAPDAVPETAPGSGDLQITREALIHGTLFRKIRADAQPGTRFRSERELQESLRETLSQRAAGEDVYLFGYGSLMWNPAIHFADAHPASIEGWRRSFCLWQVIGRGSPERPGLMLALDQGERCAGLAYRIPAADVEHELTLVWRREMGSGAYDARWIDAALGGGRRRVLAFVANRVHERYAGDLPAEQVARTIAGARGRLGTCIAYFRSMIDSLDRLAIDDPAMNHLRSVLDALLAAQTGGLDSPEAFQAGMPFNVPAIQPGVAEPPC